MKVKPPLDELYFTWLYSQVGDEHETNPSKTYWRLLKLLHAKEFTWFIAHDENRAADGLELRNEFIHAEGLIVHVQDWLDLGCSMLELLIALSRRLAFEAEGLPLDWFWHLIRNLGLEKCTDRSRFTLISVNNALERVISRSYDSKGTGGLFPLKETTENQQRVELWYQLNAYLLERL